MRYYILYHVLALICLTIGDCESSCAGAGAPWDVSRRCCSAAARFGAGDGAASHKTNTETTHPVGEKNPPRLQCGADSEGIRSSQHLVFARTQPLSEIIEPAASFDSSILDSSKLGSSHLGMQLLNGEPVVFQVSNFRAGGVGVAGPSWSVGICPANGEGGKLSAGAYRGYTSHLWYASQGAAAPKRSQPGRARQLVMRGSVVTEPRVCCFALLRGVNPALTCSSGEAGAHVTLGRAAAQEGAAERAQWMDGGSGSAAREWGPVRAQSQLEGV